MAKKRNQFIQEIIIDLKAAVAIGNIESIANALEYILENQSIASNEKLSESDLENIILPIGNILAHTNVPMSFLDTLTQDRLTGIRAMAAVAHTQRYLNGNQEAKQQVNQAVRDHRPEVGLAIAKTLEKHPDQIEKIEVLVSDWVAIAKEREWMVALKSAHILENQNLLIDLYDQVFQANLPETNKALVLSIHQRNLKEMPIPEEMITRWANVKEINPWVIKQLMKE